jgi:hypothetical protein
LSRPSPPEASRRLASMRSDPPPTMAGTRWISNAIFTPPDVPCDVYIGTSAAFAPRARPSPSSSRSTARRPDAADRATTPEGMVDVRIGSAPRAAPPPPSPKRATRQSDLSVARAHAQLWAESTARGGMIGPHDLWLAASCVAHAHALVTANVRSSSECPACRWSPGAPPPNLLTFAVREKDNPQDPVARR